MRISGACMMLQISGSQRGPHGSMPMKKEIGGLGEVNESSR